MPLCVIVCHSVPYCAVLRHIAPGTGEVGAALINRWEALDEKAKAPFQVSFAPPASVMFSIGI